MLFLSSTITLLSGWYFFELMAAIIPDGPPPIMMMFILIPTSSCISLSQSPIILIERSDMMHYISQSDGHITHISKHIVKDAKKNILIIHGMAEHRHRYLDFIKALNEHNTNAFTLELRGHGDSSYENDL